MIKGPRVHVDTRGKMQGRNAKRVQWDRHSTLSHKTAHTHTHTPHTEPPRTDFNQQKQVTQQTWQCTTWYPISLHEQPFRKRTFCSNTQGGMFARRVPGALLFY